MANILLGVTGSVAAIRTPLLYAALRELGHEVKIVATRTACYFFDPAAIGPLEGKRNPGVVILDEDEWNKSRYERGQDVLHIELRRWADLLLIAPLDANTLAKLAYGLSDNCLTCVCRAWDLARPIVLAPAMNTLMWQHPLTGRHLGELASLANVAVSSKDPESIIEAVNRTSKTLHIVAPISKQLACGDVGVGAMAEVAEVAGIVRLVAEGVKLGH
ncbi:MAG: phosphopantothenoylcysteine decarboxylase [Planctomycetes bacterium]|nr:phosphopantothenoylcysteine decarboxylase [Planctomycetota bacterium]